MTFTALTAWMPGRPGVARFTVGIARVVEDIVRPIGRVMTT